MWTNLLAHITASRQRLDNAVQDFYSGYLQGGRRLYCGQGCAGCCTLFVQTSAGEAFACANACDDALQARLSAFVARQKSTLASVTDLKTCLQLQRRVLGPCPFLDTTGSCAIYAERPLACRALLSTRPADWCAVDFATLDPFDKQAYLSSLDRSVVNFPTHYAAAPQQLAHELEEELLQRLGATCGATVTGNLPYLVHLELTVGLSRLLERGYAATWETLQEHDLLHPLLVQCHPWSPPDGTATGIRAQQQPTT